MKTTLIVALSKKGQSTPLEKEMNFEKLAGRCVRKLNNIRRNNAMSDK